MNLYDQEVVYQTILFGMVVTFLTGCTPYIMHDGAFHRGKAAEVISLVEEVESSEGAGSANYLSEYNKIIYMTKARGKFPENQKALVRDLEAIQRNPNQPSISDEGGLGLPENYHRMTVATAKAHLGLARAHLKGKSLGDAIRETEQAGDLIRDCEFCPYSVSKIQLESNRISREIYQAQGSIGKALLHKLKADLIEDHLNSERGVEAYYLEQRAIRGHSAQSQHDQIENMFAEIRGYHRRQANAAMMATVGGLTALNAGIQQGMAQAALAESGGVITPQVQRAQMNAQMAEMQSQLFMTVVAAQAGSNPKALQVNSTPWAIPTFAQQLVDPKQGTNTPTIMKGFATSAAQAGGASYQAGAQQVNEQVDALVPYRQSGKLDGAAAQVEKFAEVFNAFLTQVQEIKK